MLERLGYQVITAENGATAVDIYKDKKDQIDLVILDMIMPNMSGKDTYRLLKNVKPDVLVLLSSGYSINGQANEILENGCKGFIQKPFSLNDLSQKIRAILNDQ